MPLNDDDTSEDISAGKLVEFTDSQGGRQFGLVLIRSTNEYEDGHTDEYAEVALLPTVALMTVDQLRPLNMKEKPDASKVKESSASKASGILDPARDKTKDAPKPVDSDPVNPHDVPPHKDGPMKGGNK